jgi:hypothetical protein
MARQFREQLEEEVQLEEARKAQRAAAPPPVEPMPAAAPPREGAGSAAAPHAPANGDGSQVTTPEITDAHHAQPPAHLQPTDSIQTAVAPDADPTAGRPAQAGSADERRT